MNTYKYTLAYIELYNYDTHGSCTILNNTNNSYLFESGFICHVDTFKHLIEMYGDSTLQYKLEQLYREFQNTQSNFIIKLIQKKEELQRTMLNNEDMCFQEQIILNTICRLLHFNRHRKAKQLHLVEYVESNCNCLEHLNLEFEDDEYSSCVHLILHTYKICILQRKIKKYLNKKREFMKLIQNPKVILYKQLIGIFPKYIQRKRVELKL